MNWPHTTKNKSTNTLEQHKIDKGPIRAVSECYGLHIE